jgi:hypothetical protein
VGAKSNPRPMRRGVAPASWLRQVFPVDPMGRAYPLDPFAEIDRPNVAQIMATLQVTDWVPSEAT